MMFAQVDSAEAKTTSTELNGKGRGRGRSKAQKAAVHHRPLLDDDEQRLVKLDSTIAAAEAERDSLQRLMAEKAILKNLQAKLDETTILKQEAEARAHSLEGERNDAIQARQRHETLFKDKLYDSQHEVQNLNSTLAGLNSELHAREDELSQYRNENQKMVNELSSLRTQNLKLQRALAKEITKVEDLQKRDSENAFRQAEMAEIAEENGKLKAEVHDQAATVRRIQGQLDRLRFLERQAASQRAMPVVPSMYGPVGPTRGGYPPAEHSFYHGYPPHSQFPVAPSAPMGYMTSRAMPVQPMMSMGYAPAAPVYHFPQSLSAAPSQQVYGSDAGEDAYSEAGSGAVSISPRGNAYAGQYEQATSRHVSNRESHRTAQGWDEPLQSKVDPAQSAYEPAQPEYDSTQAASEVMQQAQEPVQAVYELQGGADGPFQEAYDPMQSVALSEVATHEPVLEAPMDGQAFLAKLQRKGSEFAEASQMPAEPSSVPAVRTESPAVPSHVPPPPVQTSRSGVISEDAAQEAASSSEAAPDASLSPEANTAEASVSDVQEPAQTDPSDPPTPVYITPLPPGYLATLPTNQQQSYWGAINDLHHPQASSSSGVSDLSGKYITPMPPQNVLNTLPTRNQQPSRDQGGQGGQRGNGTSKAGNRQKQGGHPGEARNGGNPKSSTEKKNGDNQDDAPQPQRKQARRINRPRLKGSNNSG
ncbi:TPA: hypothetical protein ACH3X1_001508 [Trebouxia sp. C0004]